MIYEIDKYTDFLVETEITPNQFFILWLLYTKDYLNQRKYIDKGQGFEGDDIKKLIDLGWIIHHNKDATAYDTRNLYVTPEFAERVLIDPEDAWSELFDAYPNHLLIEGKRVPAKTLTYTDSKGVEEQYSKLLKKNKFLHARVIAAVNKWKAENDGNATIKIDKFVMGKYWETIERTDDNTARPRIF